MRLDPINSLTRPPTDDLVECEADDPDFWSKWVDLWTDWQAGRPEAKPHALTVRWFTDPEFELQHPRGKTTPESTPGSFAPKGTGDANGDDDGPHREGDGDSGLPAGAGPAGRAEPALQPAAAVGEPAPVGPATDRYIRQQLDNGDVSPEFARGLRAAIARLPREAQDWLEASWNTAAGGRVVIRELDLTDPTLPDFVKRALGTARAATLNGYKILYAKGRVPDDEDLLHELTHVAMTDLRRAAPEVIETAVTDTEAIGTRMLDAAFSHRWRTKNPPADDALYTAWNGARYVRGMAATVKRAKKKWNKFDVTGSLELDLMLPPYAVRDFAAALGLKTDTASDQWHVLATYTALCRRYDVTVSTAYRDEELVTYKAGTDPAYAAQVFRALRRRS